MAENKSAPRSTGRIFSKNCPFNRGPCDPNCAILVERSTPGIDFGYCGLLGPLLSRNATGMEISHKGQRVYPSFFRSTEEDEHHDKTPASAANTDEGEAEKVLGIPVSASSILKTMEDFNSELR